jgi:hypothetical protein
MFGMVNEHCCLADRQRIVNFSTRPLAMPIANATRNRSRDIFDEYISLSSVVGMIVSGRWHK